MKTSQQDAELEFWRSEFARYTLPREYTHIRADRDLAAEARFLPTIYNERGFGLDLACGLVSVLEGLPHASVLAGDALMPEYDKIYRHEPRAGLEYICVDGEHMPQFADGTFDFVWCMNAIDHTPHPKRMLAEIRRILKPRGRLYFLVNFDPALYAPHYQLWNMRTVEELLEPFQLLRGTLYYEEQWQKYIWSALYV